MRSDDVIDLEALLAPISDESPTGAMPDRTTDDTFGMITEAVKDARSAERDAQYDPSRAEVIPAAWRRVREHGTKFLAGTAKHGVVATHLLVGLTYEDGLAGFRDGMRLIEGLVDRHWDGMYPPDSGDEEEIDDRVAVLASSCGTSTDPGLLPEKFRQRAAIVPTEPDGWRRDGLPALVDYARAVKQGGGALDPLRAAAKAAPDEFYRQLAADVEEAREVLRRTQTALDERCGHDRSPSFAVLLEMLDEFLRAAKDLAGEHRVAFASRPPDERAAAGDHDESGGAEAPSAGTSSARTGPIQSLDEAIDRLKQVADYFRRTQPHSILHWQLDKCCDWGRQSAAELFADESYQELMARFAKESSAGRVTVNWKRSESNEQGDSDTTSGEKPAYLS